MHCPRCGQQQISNETKFCSRCGFSMSLVAELLFNGGTLPQLASLAEKPSLINKKNGALFSLLWFLFLVLIITPITAVLELDAIVPIFAILGVFGSLFILIFSLLFLPSSKRPNFGSFSAIRSAPPGLHTNLGHNQLPAERMQPAENYVSPQGSWRAPDTGELSTPGSVTEGTTKLLDKDQ